jgi:1-acyl-sn-glycerol-3-phosphate acyltransferase
MKFLLKPFQIIYCLYAFAIFVAIMIVLFPFILIAAAFGIAGGNFIYKLLKIWGGVWFIFVGIYYKKIIESPHDCSKQYIFVGNHISYIDIPPLMLSISQPIRALGKYELVKIPIFGLIYKASVIQVDRQNAEKRAKSVRALKAAIDKGLSIFIFPEGTFNETGLPLKDFFDGAFKIAIETQTPIKPIIYPDTLKRLHYKSLFCLTPGICRSVSLQEVSVQGLSVKDVPMLKAKVYDIMNSALIKYNV